MYKLLAKILAKQLKQILPLIIGTYQGAFVAKKQILDGVLAHGGKEAEEKRGDGLQD